MSLEDKIVAKDKIVAEAVAKARYYVANQAVYYIVPPGEDDEYRWSDSVHQLEIDDYEKLHELIANSAICSDEKLIPLVATITLQDLYDEDGWVDYVADYIADNKDLIPEEINKMWALIVERYPDLVDLLEKK